ncbi:MAG: cell division protein ZapE [Pseudomonadales bacterium]|nr:cell division protein ZapE [Pseudomonadales bacterium]
MSPLEHYQNDLKKPNFVADSAQRLAVEKLQQVYEALLQEPEKASFLSKLFSKKPAKAVQGLYFWGGVGRGKTYLMDVFFDSLPFEQKMRSHFHRFMQFVHQQLRDLDGQKNPLDIIARDIASKHRVICFDEFFVTDITDAMILGGLFEQLFELGVTLIATSNIVPDKLYENGLQRQRFLPAIAQLKLHCEVVNVDGGTDYRLRTLEQADLYHWPLDDTADISLQESFYRLAPHAPEVAVKLEINKRQFATRLLADDVVWFDFAELCDGPRSQNDYIEIAREFHAVVLSNVPQLGRETDDQTRRFINLVDEFYDRNVKLVISAACSIDELYRGGGLNFEIERTKSRLLEMQSKQYLASEHRA